MRWPTPTARRWIWVPSPPSTASPGTYTLSGEVQVVAHTHNVRSGRPGYCGCGYACPHDGQMPDSYFTLPVCSLCGVSYGTPLKDLRTPTGKIIIDENNWWQDFLNTVTFGLFFPTGARFTIEAADDSVDHAGYDPELYPVTVEYLVTDQRYTSDKMGDLADQFRPYPGQGRGPAGRSDQHRLCQDHRLGGQCHLPQHR